MSMMVQEGEYIAIFNSIHRVMKAEQVLKEQGLPILLIPAPRALRADCGLAIRYDGGIRQVVEQTFAERDLFPEETYLMRGENFVRIEKENS